MERYKVAGAIGAILLLLTVVLVIKYQFDSLKRQEDLTNQAIVEMRELKDGVMRAQAQLVDRDTLEKFAKDRDLDLKPIEDDLKKLNAEIRGISSLFASTPGWHGTNLPSSGHTPRENPKDPPKAVCPDGTNVSCPSQDTFGYLSNSQRLKLSEHLSDGIQVPFGETEFRAWEEKPWNVTVFPRKYVVTTVLGQDEDGRHYTYHKFSIQADGKSYPVPIEQAQLVEELPDADFHFSPRLYLGVGIGSHVYPTPLAEVTPSLSVSLFSYGQTKSNPEWSFIGLGVGYESQAQEGAVIFTPVTYNVGKHLPLLDNLHVGPSISVDTAGSIAVTGGLFVGL